MREGDQAFDVDFVGLVAVGKTVDGTEAASPFGEYEGAGESGVELAWSSYWVAQKDILSYFWLFSHFPLLRAVCPGGTVGG